ncbi:MAG: DUF4476 domain-containing protein [Bacteroidetes bacterium]|nr:DUF4476 domain-containing protein [Bacteroidota bacterium]
MRFILKYILTTVLVLVLALNVNADNFSYVYIQGDKETPFYVKFEDQMLPRYGKNYSIIPQLSPGPIQIQILFQQNKYPAQTFTIQVPENGFRGFLLTQKGDAFSLFDLQSQFYLPSGNAIEDDKIPDNKPANTYVATNIGPEADKTISPEPVVEKPVVEAKPSKIKTEEKPEVKGPEFMNLELNNTRTSDADNTIATNEDSYAKEKVKNSDCPKNMDSEQFDAILKKAREKSDNNRLKYLLSRTEGMCYSTNQVRILTKTLPNDPERYTYLKQVYSRVTDQSTFPVLENLLSTQEWKSYFRLILP